MTMSENDSKFVDDKKYFKYIWLTLKTRNQAR